MIIERNNFNFPKSTTLDQFAWINIYIPTLTGAGAFFTLSIKDNLFQNIRGNINNYPN
jgi:hypothetical protein